MQSKNKNKDTQYSPFAQTPLIPFCNFLTRFHESVYFDQIRKIPMFLNLFHLVKSYNR